MNFSHARLKIINWVKTTMLVLKSVWKLTISNVNQFFIHLMRCQTPGDFYLRGKYFRLKNFPIRSNSSLKKVIVSLADPWSILKNCSIYKRSCKFTKWTYDKHFISNLPKTGCWLSCNYYTWNGNGNSGGKLYMSNVNHFFTHVMRWLPMQVVIGVFWEKI